MTTRASTSVRLDRRVVLIALLALVAGLGVPILAATPATADHTDAPERVTLMGSLMDELGCDAPWDQDCDATDMADVGDGTWELVADVPAGTYEYKVRLDGSWEENYGVDGSESNIPLVLLADATLRFTYDHASHRVAVEPARAPASPGPADRALATDSVRDDLTRERFYFVMADRFANGDASNDTGGFAVPDDTPPGDDKHVHGFDPTDTAFFHGGDLPGLIDRLDYIEDLGTTAIWLTPSFKNKPVQGVGDTRSAGYHGYWITDYTVVDPHLGTNDDMRELVDEAHDRGIKVFFDIITNHSADVITYDESEFDASGNLPYVSTEEEPYRRADGTNFDDRDYAGTGDFPAVDLDSFPYTPIVPADEADLKVPDWLNDPLYYHNRGVSTFSGESNTYGDFPSGPFSSLDDLWTEHPDVVDGMIDIYNAWVGDVGIDGFRIDTVKHVNIEFWQEFSPGVLDYADSIGNDDFFMFGEVFDSNPSSVSRYTTEGTLQAAVDFGFQASATSFAKGAATTDLRDFFASDDWYTDADSNVYSLPTFLGNHDMGRVGSFLTAGGGDEAELLARDQVAHALMYLTRGQPVVYYGDEQGFRAPPDVPGGIGDQRAREDMFPSQVDLYNSFDPLGTDATTADANFDTGHPLFATIADLADLVEAHPALADGAQVHRWASDDAGIYAFSRVDAGARNGHEYVVAVNNDTASRRATFDTFTNRARFERVWASGAADQRVRADQEGRITVEVPALSAVVYRANRPITRDRSTPQPFVSTVTPGGTVGGRAEIGVTVPGDAFTQVTFAWRPVGGDDWTVLGTDDNRPFRVYHDVSDLPVDAMVEYRAIAVDGDGDVGTAQTWAVVGEPADPGGGGGGPVTQPERVTTPGTFQDEVGCANEWDPPCTDIDLTLDPQDLVWKKTFEGDQVIPAGQYAYKVAIDGSWDENYGVGGQPNGDNITLDADGNPITFYYSHATNWITNSIDTPHIYVAPGNFQSELGCPGDWQPDCMRSWLQDPDGDDVWTLRTEQLPPGNYESKVAQDFDWGNGNWGEGGASEGPNLAWTVEEGEGVEFRFTPPDPSAPGETAPLVEVVTYPAEGTGGAPGPGEPDPSALAAHWLTRDTIAWDLPSDRRGWTYRLHHAPEGGLATDAEAVIGGESFPLVAGTDDLPDDLATQYPHLASYATLQLARRDARDVEDLLTEQVVVAAYDQLGRLRFANGVQIAGVLDDVHAGATERALGVTWSGATPRISLWAPTATDVNLVVWRGNRGPDTVRMRRARDGVWSARGRPNWAGASYAFDVTVYDPTEDAVVTNRVTDPYSLGLTADSARSVMVDLDDPALAPAGWDDVVPPPLAQPEDTTVYELHVRDFSATDETVPADWRGTYKAFTVDSAGTAHLRRLADAGLNTLHLLPTYDLASVPEVDPDEPACDLASFGPASTEQQACVGAVRTTDAFNWGYDPFHYTTPEGSYATDPDGPARTREYREMVQAVNAMGLRVVNDVVYNHTFAAGRDDKSVLDKVVPGYYHRLTPDTGAVETSTCCFNTASEHAMMEKLMVDSVVTWARDYKVDGFRFDLMGHHSLANMQAVRTALDELTMADDGVDGASIYLYGEGWNFGEVADDARFTQATQFNLAGTGIGSFNDRMRDAVHGGSPFDTDPRAQGFGSGLFTDPNGADINGDAATQESRLLDLQDRIKVGLAGNLADYTFVDRNGDAVPGSTDGVGYAADPSETVNYVDAHDNETLHDLFTFKLPADTSLEDRARMNTVAQATTALSQGVSFWHAGTDLLRSKSLDGDSYDSGDWFNRIDWTATDNTFGSGLPGAWRNEDRWPFMEPLLARADELTPTPAVMQATHERALDLLRLRMSSPLFRLGDADAIQQRVLFPDGGPDQSRGVITMHLSDLVGEDLDPQYDEILVVFNATPDQVTQSVDAAVGPFRLHPVQANGADPVVKTATADGTTVTVPARTVAAFVAG